MTSGRNPMLIHTLHMLVVFYSVVISVLFGVCFGFDSAKDYTIFYNGGGYTFLYYLYMAAIFIFMFLLALFSTYQSIPYGVLYWIRYVRNPSVDNKKMGSLLLWHWSSWLLRNHQGHCI